MNYIYSILFEAWRLLLESSPYIIFGLLISGILRVFVTPESIARHLGEGRFMSVFKAALFGIPIPLCSCGVLPAAVSLKKQGANNGATTAFLISTPESGVDSIAITYALLDPIMTVARPVAAFLTAAAAGVSENLFNFSKKEKKHSPDLSCPVDGCCDGKSCTPEQHRHSLSEKITAGLKYSVTEVWSDMAAWFFMGLLLAGVIMTFVPEKVFTQYLGGGLSSMILMLATGIPLYICATASTPVAAALILKGVSPGAALVFLIAGPATNITSLAVLFGVLGKRASAIYLTSIALFSVISGLLLDRIYFSFDIPARAVTGHAAELIPVWLEYTGAFLLLLFSIKPVFRSISSRFKRIKKENISFTSEIGKNSPGKDGCTGSD
jgi:uncharacterized membrane protein YraQ (UPF0718 family)